MTLNYHAVARRLSVTKAIVARLAALPARKSINEVTQEYRDLLERLVVDAANGTISSGSFASQMREAIVEDARAVYLEGMREAGINDPEAELDSDDEAAIGDWTLSQAKFINSFRDDALAVNDLEGDVRTTARNAMLDRVDTWVASLEALGRLGGANARENMPGTWQLGKTEQHCATCAKLDGQRHRLKWFIGKGYIPGQPGSDTLDCGGWNCDCSIVGDDGERLL